MYGVPVTTSSRVPAARPPGPMAGGWRTLDGARTNLGGPVFRAARRVRRLTFPSSSFRFSGSVLPSLSAQFSLSNLRKILPVQTLANQRLDHSLAADVQLLCGSVQLFQHGGRKIDIYALNRLHHLSGIREKTRNILSSFRKAGNRLGSVSSRFFTRALHTTSFPPWSISTVSPNGEIRLPRPHESQRSPNTGMRRPSQLRGIAPDSPDAGPHNTDARRFLAPPQSQFRASGFPVVACSSAHQNQIAQIV